MKFVPSMAHQLSKAEDRIESLTKSNCELQEEIRRLRLKLARATRIQPKKSIVRPSASPKVTRSSISEETRPSYARTTKAFRIRNSSSCQRQQPIAKPSKLPMASHSSIPGETTPSYARSTESARLHSSSSSPGSTSSTSPETDWSPITTPSPTYLTIHENACSYEDGELNVMKSGYPTTAASHTGNEFPQPPGVLNSLGPTWAPCCSLTQTYNVDCAKGLNRAQNLKPSKAPETTSRTEKGEDQVLQEGIASRTRLADKAWINGLFPKVYINHDSLYKILSEAQELAKECVWTWVRIHRPQCLGWLGYLSDVDFSGDKFHRFIKCMPSDFFNFRHSKSQQLKGTLRNLVDLRNLLCHFNGSRQDVRRMCVHLQNIHELAVLFYDEPRAGLARALRDKLHAEAERTLQEIETLTMLTTLPEGGDPWLRHHSSTVQDAVGDLDRRSHLPSQKHPILVTAAREWAAHHMCPGGWEYGTSIPIPEVEGEYGDGGLGFR